MTYNPRTDDEVYESIKEKLQSRISRLTNFTTSSFNYVWTRAYARRFRDAELAVLASQLSGWVDYSGGPITEDDLERLGVTDVSPEEVNQFMDDEDLDELAELVGIDRGLGESAQGEVTFTTQSQLTTIPEGTSVGTTPDENNEFLEYTTDVEVETAAGETEVSGVPITAVDVGEEYNIGLEISYLPSPPTGVQSVTNNEEITGGSRPETNDQYRQRIKNAIFSTSGGGTALGVEGFVQNEVEDVTSVSVKEYPGGNQSLAADSPSPGGPGTDSPFADVIVQGGNTTELEDAISEARPVAIQHNLVRPNFVDVGVSAQISASSAVEVSEIEDSINGFLSNLELGQDVYRDKLIQRIMNVTADIENIEYLEVRVENERHIYDSDNSGGDAPNHPLYKLNKGDSMEYDSSVDSSNPSRTGITQVNGVFNGDETEFVEDTSFDEGTVDGSSPDAIDWSVGTDTPDEDAEFFVNYAIEDDLTINEYQKATFSANTDITIL